MQKLTLLILSILYCFSTNAQQATILKEINPNGSSYYGDITFVHNDIMYFLANDGTTGPELWRSDGTTTGTYLLKEIFPDANNYIFSIDFAVLGNEIIMGVAGKSDDYAIWKTDGTTQGTVLVSTLSNDYPDWRDRLVTLGNYVYFAGYSTANGPELWRTDGTPSGTSMVKNISSSSSRGPKRPMVWNNKLLFYHEGSQGYELWTSDGTEVGTTLVKDINPGSFGSMSVLPQEFDLVATPIGVFFTANDGTNGQELWITDGTEAGTKMVKNINSSTINDGAVLNGAQEGYQNYAFLNGKFYFNGTDATNGDELWATDGTTAGTTLVKNAVSGASGLRIRDMVVLNNQLIFNASTTNEGNEMWISDGTSAGTKLIKDIAPSFGNGVGPSYDVVVYANRVWFSGQDLIGGGELWRTDGTAMGTEMVQNINPGFANSYPEALTVLGDKLLFFANNGSPENYELYSIFDPAVATNEPAAVIRSVYINPNPNSGYFQLYTDTTFPENATVQIVSMLGQVVSTTNWVNNNQLFETSHFAKGLYHLIVRDAQGKTLSSHSLLMQ
jgi:ELWxxDGT repeat protein